MSRRQLYPQLLLYIKMQSGLKILKEKWKNADFLKSKTIWYSLKSNDKLNFIEWIFYI